jgi:uncharacterized membrane protein
MNLEFDPVWPWSLLRLYLAEAEPGPRLALWLAGVTALVLPLLMLRSWSQVGRRRLLLLGGLLLGGLLAWPAYAGTYGPSTSLAERLRGPLLSLFLLAVPFALLGLTLQNYLSLPTASGRRVTVLVGLRLLAFLLAVLAVLRPALAFLDRGKGAGGVLYIAGDTSESMSIKDENRQPRWSALLEGLARSKPALDRLRLERNLEIEFVGFSGTVTPLSLDNPGQPDGRHTDIAGMLKHLYDNRDRRTLVGVVVCSDGRHNGSQNLDPMAEARRFRKLKCPVHAILYGDVNTRSTLIDVAVTKVTTESPLIQVKSEVVVKALVDAPGFDGRKARLRLLINNEEVPAIVETPVVRGNEGEYERSPDGQITLRKAQDNEVRLRCPAPDKPGEIKITVQAEYPLRKEGQDIGFPNEHNVTNNRRSTLATVTKGGISVLLVDRIRTWEPQMLKDVLVRDPRVILHTVWLSGESPLPDDKSDLLQIDKHRYDVILLGDVTAAQLTAANPRALDEIARQVEQGAGLLAYGGYNTFGNGDWRGTSLEAVLPVDLSQTGQVEQKVQVVPLPQGAQRKVHYVLVQKDGKLEDEKTVWSQLPLKGIVRLKERNTGKQSVLAETPDRMPVLISTEYGKGRVLAFAGDTTHRWVVNKEGRDRHDRLWRRLTVWLAHQEEAEGVVWALPDVRDLPLGKEIGFAVGVRSRLDPRVNLDGGQYVVEVVGPDKAAKRVTIKRLGDDNRGLFKPEVAGEYTIRVVEARARDTDGSTVEGSAEARFLVHEEEVEMTVWAADRVFMEKLAREGQGQFRTASKLTEFLEQFPQSPATDGKQRLELWPDWRNPNSSTLPMILVLLFVAALSTEWGLRRWWSMV